MKGIFDDYIDKYKKIKMTSKGAIRELAKLFLNNLYGKMAANENSSFKVPYMKDGVIAYYVVEEYEKEPGYIPVGAAITSYARCWTIRAAQKNYHGVDKPGFIYADTDSLHCDLPEEELIDIPTHPTEFCHFKIETHWEEAIFTRQKTYIEKVVVADGKQVDPYYLIKCAGMPQKCKDVFGFALITKNGTETEKEQVREKVTKLAQAKKLTQEQVRIIEQGKALTEFKVGLKIPGKLMPKHYPGGVLLVDTYYTMN